MHEQNNDGGSKDGQGAGDHDEAYTFGYRPTVKHPWPFSPKQYGHLLILRGRAAEEPILLDDQYPDVDLFEKRND